MALSERQERMERLQHAKSELRRAISAVPASVLNGGVIRARAWKAAAEKANKLLNGNSEDCTLYERALIALRSAESTNDVSSLASMVIATKGVKA